MTLRRLYFIISSIISINLPSTAAFRRLLCVFGIIGLTIGSVLVARSLRNPIASPVVQPPVASPVVQPNVAQRLSPPQGDELPLDFNRQVRPILAEYCYACHGPSDEGRKADLRLDTQEGATQESSSGRPVVSPHDPDGSELIARVLSSGSDVMPPK